MTLLKKISACLNPKGRVMTLEFVPNELVEELSRVVEGSLKDGEVILDQILASIVRALQAGDKSRNPRLRSVSYPATQSPHREKPKNRCVGRMMERQTAPLRRG